MYLYRQVPPPCWQRVRAWEVRLDSGRQLEQMENRTLTWDGCNSLFDVELRFSFITILDTYHVHCLCVESEDEAVGSQVRAVCEIKSVAGPRNLFIANIIIIFIKMTLVKKVLCPVVSWYGVCVL